MNDTPIRYSITFNGHVQGVGFRYTAERIANGMPIAGWVRNERDGSVQCVIEGEKDQLDRFIAQVRRAMEHNIHEARIEEGPATGEFTRFGIRF